MTRASARGFQRRTNLLLVALALGSVGMTVMLARLQTDALGSDALSPALNARPSQAVEVGKAAPADDRITLDLRARQLTVPVAGVSRASLINTFGDARERVRQHEAMDILAPRGTRVLAVEDGEIVKLFTSDRGGLTVYQFDPARVYAYYYAHLDSYAPDLQEGMRVERGRLLGFVGTTGNAPKDTPHLHFAIFLLTAEKHWWQGTAINPFDVWR